MARKTKPSFFQVLIGDFSNKLRIQQAFHKHFDGRIPQQSSLRTPTGTRLVDVNSDNGMLFLQKGWKQFVKDNGLKLGEFLIFRYCGNSKFNVELYGRHGCRKEFVTAATTSERPLEKRQCEEIHRTNANSKYVGSSSTSHSKQKMDYDQNLEGCTGGYRASQETVFIKPEPISDTELETTVGIDEPIRNMNTRDTSASQPQAENLTQAAALEAAKKYSSNNPCFITQLTESYATKGLLHIPSTFVKDIKIKRSTAKLQVSNRLWSVKWITDHHSSRFSQGWTEFVRENDLKVGDACVFELIKQTDDTVMKVYVFRCCSS
ncbi:B3 domain-containing protein LOC_Os12g40080 [Argentina anserina]|uniref:B3 domain-containing protein LOC_Os12g40080 n=1 Tax=Argentina anserina TaxID=57926 RepID=UPI002176693E|nr:B3 domain-containing protein LOC_Os12g40080 [Potentilla anserina]